MKKNFMKYSILIWAWMILWVVASNIWNVFGAQDPNDPIEAEKIVNTACIEYTTPSWTGVKCDNAVVMLKTWNAQQHEYFIKKRQKTWGMASFTASQITVQSWEYIQYKVDFGSITWTCKKGTIKDQLPSCVRYVSSSIEWVVVTQQWVATGEHFVQYSWFRLNSGASWYILVTGQIIGNDGCENTTRYVNTWSFKCWDPSSSWMHSSVIAIRTWWGGWGGWSWSEVIFTKDGNKDQMVPGETWLIFTLKVINNGPNPISGIVIDDIWPNNNCIIFDWWTWQHRSGNAYTWQYVKWNWVLQAGWTTTVLKLYAKIANDQSCTWPYINTWKLTYQEWWETHTLYDDYPFKVVNGSAGYDVSIEKTVYPNNPSHGQDITYTITYRNIWTKPLTGYTITDNWPYDDVEFIRSKPNPRFNDGKTITWFFTWPLAPSDYWTIIINAKVK